LNVQAQSVHASGSFAGDTTGKSLNVRSLFEEAQKSWPKRKGQILSGPDRDCSNLKMETSLALCVPHADVAKNWISEPKKHYWASDSVHSRPGGAHI
jgi:hypothetical protein